MTTGNNTVDNNLETPDGFRPSGFIKYYLKYHKMRTDAEDNFAVLLAIQMLGQMFGYDCYHCINPDVIRHNMYLALIGISSLSRKSTAQRIAKESYVEDENLPNDITPESLLDELAKKSKGMLWYGEWTYLLKGIGSKNYMGRIVEILNEIFDCPLKFERKIKTDDEPTIIDKAYLSFNTTCTPAMLEKYVNREMMEGGFFARFLITMGKLSIKPRWRLKPEIDLMKEKITNFLKIVESLFFAENVVKFELTDDALERFKEIELELSKHTKISPFMGRYANYILSIADILLISDLLGEYLYNGKLYELKKFNKLSGVSKVSSVSVVSKVSLDKQDNTYKELENELSKLTQVIRLPPLTPLHSIRVKTEYIDQAYEVIKPSIEYANELAEYVDVEIPIIKLERIIKKHEKMERRLAMRHSNLNARDMKLAVETLEQQGKVYGSIEKSVDSRGVEHSTQYIQWRTDDDEGVINPKGVK